MADIDLKTETPDTTLPTTGFLFGADSQAAASPSVFTVQSVATTLLGSSTLTGATVTTSSPVIDAAQTWNDGAVTFTGLRFNAATGSSAGSAAASLLMDLQLEGTSRFSVRKDGYTIFASTLVGNTGSGVGIGYSAQGRLTISSGGRLEFGSSGVNSPDTFLTRKAAANIRLGAADGPGTPVAQTLSVQSVTTPALDTAGANLTITGSQGTGTGAGGSIIFQVAPAGTTGTAQNALATALTINSNRTAQFFGNILVETGNLDVGSGGTGTITTRGLRININQAISFSDGTQYYPIINLDAANTLALRNGANAQEFRVYSGYVDDSNYSRLVLGEIDGGGNFYIKAARAGSGTARGLNIRAGTGKGVTIGYGAIDAFIFSAAGLQFNGLNNTYDIGNSSARVRNFFLGSYAQITEMTAPDAPAANNVRIYAENDGAGKTRLMARFATGAAVQIAIEP